MILQGEKQIPIEEEFAVFNQHLNGQMTFEAGALYDTNDFFRKKGWLHQRACQKDQEVIDKIVIFYNEDKLFKSLTADSLQDLEVVYSIDSNFQIEAVFSFGMWEIQEHLLTYIFTARVSPEQRCHGIYKRFIKDLEECMASQVFKYALDSCSIMAALRKGDDKIKLIYNKLGFSTKIPAHLRLMKVNGCILRVIEVDTYAVGGRLNQPDKQPNEEIKEVPTAAPKEKKARKSLTKAAVKVTNASRCDIPESSIVLDTESEDEPIEQSFTSSVSKSSQGRVHKHCLDEKCALKRIDGKNWARHINTVHKGVKDLRFEACPGSGCRLCNQVNSQHISNAKYKQCVTCNASKRSDNLVKETKQCKQCFKQGATGLKRSPPQKLDKLESAIMAPPEPRRIKKSQVPLVLLDVDDGCSINGDVQYSDHAMEVDSQQVDLDAGVQEQADIVQDEVVDITELTKDQRVDYILSNGSKVLVVDTKDDMALRTLVELETSSDCKATKCQILQSISSMLNQPYVTAFLSRGEHPVIAELVLDVTDRLGQLDRFQAACMIYVSFILGRQCWDGAVRMLGRMKADKLNPIIDTFFIFLQNAEYKANLCEWIVQFWKVSNDQHVQLIKHLNKNPLARSIDILKISLVVVVDDINGFVKFTDTFLDTAVSKLVLQSIMNIQRQQKITFTDFKQLMFTVQSSSKEAAVEKLGDKLGDIPISQWKHKIEEQEIAVNVANSSSIQQFIEELEEKYGEIKHLNRDLTSDVDIRFEIIMSEFENKPNCRQFALAQYCIGRLYQQQKQLWVVPSGQGKSRIIAMASAIALLCEVYERVHLVFSSKYLMERDRKEFEELWMLVGMSTDDGEGQVQYHLGLDFECDSKSLVIIDEADIFMFGDAEKFRSFVNGISCVCFTATPDNGKTNGVEQKFIDMFMFKRFEYMIEGNQDLQAFMSLEVDEVPVCEDDKQKAQYIVSKSTTGPVLVFGSQSLIEEIIALGQQPLIIAEDQEINSKVLRSLDQMNSEMTHYKIVVSPGQFGMRGIDYRSVKANMTLVIAQSFDNQREAIQGFNRVGRFGDQCYRVRFNDVEIVNRMVQSRASAAMFNVITQMQKKPIVLKQVQVKCPVERGASSRLGQKRISGMLAQPEKQGGSLKPISSYFSKE